MRSLWSRNNNVVFLSIFILVIAAKCLMLSRISFDIDSLDSQLRPVLKNMSINARIGFWTNNQDSYVHYLEAKSIATPYIFLFKDNLDTMIVLQNKALPLKRFVNYKVMARTETNNCVIEALARKR